MLRRTVSRHMFKRRMPKTSGASETTDFEHTLDKMLNKAEEIQKKRKVKFSYDKSEKDRFVEKLEEESELAENVPGSGRQGEGGRTAKNPVSMQDVTEKPLYEKVYDADLLKTSTVEDEYKVPPLSPTAAEDRHRWFIFKSTVGSLMTLGLILLARKLYRLSEQRTQDESDRVAAEIRKQGSERARQLKQERLRREQEAAVELTARRKKFEQEASLRVRRAGEEEEEWIHAREKWEKEHEETEQKKAKEAKYAAEHQPVPTQMELAAATEIDAVLQAIGDGEQSDVKEKLSIAAKAAAEAAEQERQRVEAAAAAAAAEVAEQERVEAEEVVLRRLQLAQDQESSSPLAEGGEQPIDITTATAVDVDVDAEVVSSPPSSSSASLPPTSTTPIVVADVDRTAPPLLEGGAAASEEQETLPPTPPPHPHPTPTETATVSTVLASETVNVGGGGGGSVEMPPLSHPTTTAATAAATTAMTMQSTATASSM